MAKALRNCGEKPRLDCHTFAAILFMPQHFRPTRRRLARSGILRSIIHDDHRSHVTPHSSHQRANRARLIEARDDRNHSVRQIHTRNIVVHAGI